MKNLLTIITIGFLSSFAPAESSEYIGTYGTSENDPAQISLTIHADYTCTYTDF